MYGEDAMSRFFSDAFCVILGLGILNLSISLVICGLVNKVNNADVQKTVQCPTCVAPKPMPTPMCGRDEVLYTDVSADGKSSSPRCVPTRPTCMANEVKVGASCIPIQLPSMVVCTANEVKIGDIKNRIGKIVAEDCIPLPPNPRE